MREILIDFYAAQSMLRPGQVLQLAVETESSSSVELVAEITVYHLAETVARLQQTFSSRREAAPVADMAAARIRTSRVWLGLRLLDPTGRVVTESARP